MNVKSTLWALAFACAAVSCSDDIDAPANENQVNGGGSPMTYMTVNINPGTVTKAGESDSDGVDPTGGEEGDGYEIGEENEWTVKDVTVVLFTDKEGKAPTAFSADCKLIGAGYATVSDMSASTELNHSRQATVTVSITDSDEATFDGKTYGVITVANLGSDALKNKIGSDITDGVSLMNLLIPTVQSNGANFIMSTHNDEYANAAKIFDQVTLKANSTKDNAPEATVHVERLAAKVRINAYDGITGFSYTMNAGADNEATVQLTDVAIVNQLSSGTYLLKRVTTDVTSGKAIPAVEGDLILGNETANADGSGLNYVITPWTRNIDLITDWTNFAPSNVPAATDIVPFATTYSTSLDLSNAYIGKDYATVWKALSSTSLNDVTTQKTLAYTQENTTSAAMSKNGFSTGALFKAVYYPKNWMAVTKDGEKDVVKAVPVLSEDENSTAKTFYVYKGEIYKDYEAVFNRFAWVQQTGEETIYSYDDFKSDNIAKIKKADFKNSKLYQFADADPMGYLSTLAAKCSADDLGEATFESSDDIETYISSNGNKIAEKVNTYENGVCYYPYWIRHANNNKPTDMGIMEFGIVRNNIYDLAVKSIGSLGLSGIDKPQSDKDDESKELKFEVTILVKNWVLRQNTDIIL